ncbi:MULTISPECIES: TnpV protein [unclassified Dehalobacter]|uniref:TnpV protein n=1 Tax=unclassified Dehalobacter TaxID=2635733 RepID=UPI0009DB2688|nr:MULTISPECIES: TnpV protein [unclassified Dehalobacter]
MELTYTQQGDYLIPDLTLQEKEAPIGKYGMLHKTYLKNHKKGMYASLMLSVKLNSHLAEIDRTAKERVEQITSRLLMNSPAPDKASNQMAWVGHMNSLRHQAEETVLTELIYN